MQVSPRAQPDTGTCCVSHAAVARYLCCAIACLVIRSTADSCLLLFTVLLACSCGAGTIKEEEFKKFTVNGAVLLLEA